MNLTATKIIRAKINPRIFNDVYRPLLKDNTRIQILFGGSSSGKSYFSAQRCILDIAEGDRNYLCVRNVKATIKNSVFNELSKAIANMHLLPYFKINHSELLITCVNGYQIMFAGLDDVEKVKSITPAKGVITDIWIEEATEVARNDVRQLLRRLRGKCNVVKRLIMSFNPILISSWIYTEYFGEWDETKTFYRDDKKVIIKTTYKDNLRFLDQGDIDELENETDPYFRDVYTLGNWGVLGNLIFKNWEVMDLMEQSKTFDNYKNGLDFGFSSDPAAAIRTHYDPAHKTIYVTKELYTKELTNDMLAVELKEIIASEYIRCDSAEPKSIRELRNLHINALAARKGKDSVNFGIDWLKRQRIIIDSRCQNTKNEFQQYKWKEDSDGNVLKVPVGKMDHLIDALRYAYEDEMENRKVTAERSF